MSSDKHVCDGSCANGLPVDGASKYPDGISRRTFMMQSALMAAAAALAACGMPTGVDSSQTLSSSQSINVANYPELASVGGVATVDVSGIPMAIVRTSATTFLALSLICPHQGGTISHINSTTFQCPIHGATFNNNGQWIGGQPTSNMRQYSTSYNQTSNTLTIS